MNELSKFFLQNQRIFFFVILFIGIALRFYNINWGAPFYFHPDERQNIAYPVQQSKSLLLRDQKNFDINPFPLIVIKNTYQLITLIPGYQSIEPIQTTIIISRIYSAVFSILISILLFYIGKRFWNYMVGYIAFTLSVFSTGLIQYAHFGTIELWEGLILLIIFLLSSEILKNKKVFHFFILGAFYGLGVSTKFLTISFFPIVLFSFFPFIILIFRKKNKETILNLLRCIYLLLVGFVITIFIFFPQLFLSFHQIQESLKFESTVATGQLRVFFTQGFTNTIPVIYQLRSVFPFILNPLILLLGIFALGYSSYYAITKKKMLLFLLVISFTIPFLATSLLFVKWTRYMIPFIPFVYLLVSITTDLYTTKIRNKTLKNILVGFLILISIVFSVSFFVSTYIHKHTTVDASIWFNNHYKDVQTAISENYDIGITPFNSLVKQVELVDFYNLDAEDRILISLNATLPNTQFVILPSQRILKSRLQNPKDFPRGNKFYSELLGSSGSYKMIYKTPCDIFCKIAYLGDPTFSFEETVSVFDRPTVYIFKNNTNKK